MNIDLNMFLNLERNLLSYRIYSDISVKKWTSIPLLRIFLQGQDHP